MNKSCTILGKLGIFLVFLLLIAGFAGPSLADNGPIGKVAVFSGEVLYKSQGVWGEKMVVGLPIYSGDKLVTLDGSAELVFEDGTYLTLCRYSSLEFKQWTRRGLPLIQSDLTRRRFTLYMGKMWIETDYKKMRSEIATPPMVSGLREDKGTTRIAVLVSLDEKGEAFMSFDEGDRSFTIGPWKIGTGENVPPGTARENEFITKALAAKTAAQVAQRASDASQEEDVAESTRKLAWVRANKAAAEESLYCAKYLELWTPDKQILADAKENIRQSKERLQSATEGEKALLEAGASEEEWNTLKQAEMDASENQRVVEGVDAGSIGSVESSNQKSEQPSELKDLDMPKPGAFANKNPCD